MAANEYQFLTAWSISAPQPLIYEILKNGADYPRWWPDVYLEANLHSSGRPDGIGDRVVLLTKGRLPYKLRWTAISEEFEPPSKIGIRAEGDFVGSGVWRLKEREGITHVTFDWRLRADKPLLRWLSPLLKPLFRWNHHWAMSTGLTRLKLEAQKRMSES